MPTGEIDSEIADVDWERNTQTQAPPVNRRSQPDDDGDPFGASQYTKARAVSEHYQARLAKIDYEERDREAGPRKTRCRSPRSTSSGSSAITMLNIPDRVAAMLAAETVNRRSACDSDCRDPKALNDFADCNG